MKIRSIRIELEVVDYVHRLGPGVSELRVTIDTVDRKRAGINLILPDDDFESRFDYIWQRAGEQLREHFKEMADETKP